MPSSLQHILDFRQFAIKDEFLRCLRNCTHDIKKEFLAFIALKSTAVSSNKFNR